VETPLTVAPFKQRIPTLDGWRAIAILLVLLHHAGTGFFESNRYWAHSPTRFGVIGVPIFFALSGFLITNLLLDESDRRGQISLLAFYVRRCFRILPPLFVYVLVVGGTGLIQTKTELLSALFFFRNYVPQAAAGIYTNHLWSLSVEEHFYLLWPLTLCFLVGRKRVLTGTAAIALLLGIWGMIDFHLHLIHRLVPVLDTATRSDLRLGGLMWGCCAGIIYQSARFHGLAVRYYRPPLFWCCLGLLCATQRWYIPLSSLWSSALIPLLILGTVLHPASLVSSVLEWPPLQWIGRISYGVYLWQQMFLIPLWEPRVLHFVQTWPVNLLMPFLCAIASYWLLERWMISLGRQVAQAARQYSKSGFSRSPGVAAIASVSAVGK
jgi:peptidoglycan/LPS O-acetylase OafA/YrhL